jgi:DNA adenine methylase
MDDRQGKLWTFSKESVHMGESFPEVAPYMRPFLKWAGGKSRLVGTIDSCLPTVGADGKPFNRLVEPFMGSGSVFLGIKREAYLASDINKDLVDLFMVLRRDKEDFVERCRLLFKDTFSKETDSASYYDHRDEFNATAKVLSAPAGVHQDHVVEEAMLQRAALFVYLNRHCFNGLCRYNSKGGFNVPVGQHSTPYFPEKEMLDFANMKADVTIACNKYEDTLEDAKAGDVVYCDPPYDELSNTASFDAYAKGGFSRDEQHHLAELCRGLASNGIPVLISNHWTDFTVSIYGPAPPGASYQVRCRPEMVRRSISGSGASRNKAREILALFLPNGVGGGGGGGWGGARAPAPTPPGILEPPRAPEPIPVPGLWTKQEQQEQRDRQQRQLDLNQAAI